jgi:hypothetical protein
MDNASSEYLFTIDFFIVPNSKKNIETMGAAFNEIFDPTIKIIQAVLKQYVETSYDAVGVLICIRINQQNLRIMQARRIPALEAFMNATNMLLWPKFQSIMDMHVESLRSASTKNLMSLKDVRPHYVC